MPADRGVPGSTSARADLGARGSSGPRPFAGNTPSVTRAEGASMNERDSWLASVCDDCVAERSMRLCDQQPPVPCAGRAVNLCVPLASGDNLVA